MILVLLAIFITIFVVGIILFERRYDWIESLGGGLSIVGGAGTFLTLIFIIFLAVDVSCASTLNEKIEMYQEENETIEAQIASVVQQYQQYESDIFMEVAPDDSVALVALYPELRADFLVQKQIEIYVSNNEKIKSLKSDQISASVKRWWLYFGG